MRYLVRAVEAAGSAFTASVTGFAAGETVQFSDAGNSAGSCTANASGDCSVTITVPALPAAAYTVVAVGATSGLGAQATFTQT